MTAWNDRADALLLEALLGPLGDSMREVGLPLHVLLESRFGELNENQVEMIEAARTGVEVADRLLRRAERIRALEGRPRTPRDETTRPLDLCRGALAIASARAATRGVRLEADLSPALPRARGDRAHLEEAMTLLLGDAAERAEAGGRVEVVGEGVAGTERLHLRVQHGAVAAERSLDRLLALRLIEGEGGTVAFAAGAEVVTLLAEAR